eukprot:COSAG01_NODE_42171_length_442_cov_7.956268_2_plen_53_part_01
MMTVASTLVEQNMMDQHRVLIDQALLMIGLDPPAEYNPCDAAQVLLARTTTML